MPLSLFWFRRDLRLEDNIGLYKALNSGLPVMAVFIFDQSIIEDLAVDDPRVYFIYQNLLIIDEKLRKKGSSLKILKGEPVEIWKELLSKYQIATVFTNKDYEPYAIKRDQDVKALLNAHGIRFCAFKDQVIYEENEIVKNDGKPYTVFTPYKKKWLQKFHSESHVPIEGHNSNNYCPSNHSIPQLLEIKFRKSFIKVKDYDLSQLDKYASIRDIPAEDATSYLGPHLRFGTISIRQVISHLGSGQEVFLSELIWREFFMQILYHFPKVVNQNFRSKYDHIEWRNNEKEFKRWCQGTTGYPLVDAGIRQLNATGYMHNRVRMVVAGFLCKHLLIDWRWGEAYFAEKLLDYELASNNGNWQWAAGTGCDAAPYFRVFNPARQLERFDKDLKYVLKWVPEYQKSSYILPIVEHKFARDRALKIYKRGLINKR